MNSIVNPQKGHCFCSSLYTCISCRKFNYKKQCTLYSNSHSASMGSKNLVPPIPLDNSCSIGQLCLAVTNWRIDISDPWVLNTIQGYKIDFWVQLIESPSQAPSFLPEGDNSTAHRDSQASRETSYLHSDTASPLRLHFQNISSFQKRQFSKTGIKLTSTLSLGSTSRWRTSI